MCIRDRFWRDLWSLRSGACPGDPGDVFEIPVYPYHRTLCLPGPKGRQAVSYTHLDVYKRQDPTIRDVAYDSLYGWVDVWERLPRPYYTFDNSKAYTAEGKPACYKIGLYK